MRRMMHGMLYCALVWLFLLAGTKWTMTAEPSRTDSRQTADPRTQDRDIHASQRPDGDSSRGPQDTVGRRKRLVQGRVEG